MKQANSDRDTYVNGMEVITMDKIKLRNKRHKHIAKGQSEKVGRLERLTLRWYGSIDGKNGLPREDKDGRWGSPFIDEKVRAFAVFGDNEWKNLQHEHEELYVRMEELMCEIRQKKTLLGDAQDLLSESDYEPEIFRKKGEDGLSENVVKARRAAERAKKIAPVKREIDQLKTEIFDVEKELRKIVGFVEEECNTVKMFLHSKRDSMFQRMDIYWNAAMKKHPESNRMPLIPIVEVELEHEKKYMAAHRKKIEDAEKYLKISEENMVKEAA